MVSLQNKPLIFAKIADIPLPERPNLPTQTIEGHEEEADLSSWVEASVAEVVADSAEEVSVEVASEAVEPEADSNLKIENLKLNIRNI